MHNAARRPRRPTLLGLALLLIAGCGPGGDTPPGDAGTGSGAPGAAAGCGIRVDPTVWDAFRQAGDGITAGTITTREEYGAFATLPMAALWCESQGPGAPTTSLNLTNWLEEAFRPELGEVGSRKLGGNRRLLGQSYRYSYDKRADIDSLLSLYAESGALCAQRELMARWIQPDNLPDEVTVAFLPAKPETRAIDGTILVDTGLLQAGGLAQTQRQIAGLAYRWFQMAKGPHPNALAGEEAVVATLTMVRDEGIAAWIDQRPFTFFRREHPILGKVNLVPEDYLKVANLAVAYADSNLPGMLADPGVMADNGLDFPRRMTASDAFTRLGFAMASAIEDRFGEQALVEAAASVSGFFAAYQRAAQAYPEPRPAPGEPGHPWPACLKPFAPDVAAGIQDLLAAKGL